MLMEDEAMVALLIDSTEQVEGDAMIRSVST